MCGAQKIELNNGVRRCPDCHRKHGRNYYHNSSHRRERLRQTYVERRYGVSLDFLQELLIAQDMRCGICRTHWSECIPAKAPRREESFLQYLCVDHDHERPRVRGLLCNACNAAIGLFEEDPLRLISAIEYLYRGVAS
jgi:hypothetical protein